ncbi:hypothetical protein [Ferdinandcohnia sp. Marseille-Q9671]
MIRNVLVSLFIFQIISTTVMAQPAQQIQVFDVKQGEVIQHVERNTEIQKEVEIFLERITGVFSKYNPIPSSGYMIRIPLEPNIVLRNKWFDDLVDEVTIVLSGQDDPYLMIFDDENKPYFLLFEGNIDKLLALFYTIDLIELGSFLPIKSTIAYFYIR